MTEDMMMGERDIEAELKEKDEIIMSLRLNEHLLKDKLEISRRNMSKQLERIKELEKENERLKNKLNITALELVDEAISMGKAVEISEMNYHEFLEYRQNKGKPMELQR